MEVKNKTLIGLLFTVPFLVGFSVGARVWTMYQEARFKQQVTFEKRVSIGRNFDCSSDMFNVYNANGNASIYAGSPVGNVQLHLDRPNEDKIANVNFREDGLGKYGIGMFEGQEELGIRAYTPTWNENAITVNEDNTIKIEYPFKMKSPNGREFTCGVDDLGNFECEAAD